MSYRSELRELQIELENRATELDFASDPKASEKFDKLRRQAEIISFLLDHTEDAVKNLDTE